MLTLACARLSHSPAALALTSLRRCAHTYEPTYVPVVICGAGPTGLVLSCLLSQYGIKHMVLERSQQLTQHPQAHYINNRTMEVFRGLDGLAAAVKASSPPLKQWRRFIYCEALAAGQLLGQVDHFPGQTTAQDPSISPEPVTHLSQHRLLPLLLQQAQQLSAANGTCADIRFGSAVTAVSNVEFPHQQPHTAKHHTLHGAHLQHHSIPQQLQTANVPAPSPAAAAAEPLRPPGSTATAGTAAAGAGRHLQQQDEAAQDYPVCVAVRQQQQQQQGSGGAVQLVRCSYLVAADGAHSTVRSLLEIPMQGDHNLQHLMSIHFTCPALGQALLQQQRSGMLYFVFNRQLVAVLVAHDLAAGEFVAQVPYYPPLQAPADFTSEVCKQLIAHAAGWSLQQLQQPPATAAAAAVGQPGLQLHSVKPWVMSAVVAQEYSAWDGRVLLAGDAAHRFPPAGGFGMNTGIQDAHNLAWKLAAVLSCTADPALLQTYQAERRPVALANTALSVNNWHEALRVPQALGLDPRAAGLVNQIISAAPVPEPVGRWLLDSALAVGRGVAVSIAPLRKAALEEILQSGKSLRLQFPKEDLGVVYTEGAVATGEGQGGRQKCAGASSSSSSSRGSPYVPSTAVGGRLPHFNLALLRHDGKQEQVVSSLDLVAADSLGLNMLLICSGSTTTTTSSSSSSATGGQPEQDWISAGRKLQQEGWPIKLMQIVPPGGHCAVHDGVLTAVNIDGTWEQLHSGSDNVAVLVRPDGHVAWRRQGSKQGESSAAVYDELLVVLKDVLHLCLAGTAAAHNGGTCSD